MKTIPLALALVLSAGGAQACDKLSASDAWIRGAAPGARVLVGYVALFNPGKSPITIDRASGAAFGAVEVHETLIEHGMSRMRRLKTLDVPAGGRTALKPGGKHLMLFRPQRELAVGDVVEFQLHCGGSVLSVPFTVKPDPQAPQ